MERPRKYQSTNHIKKELFEVKKEKEVKMKKEYGHTENPLLDDVSALLDSSSSDSETFQKFRREEYSGRSKSEGAAGGSQIQTKQTVSEKGDLFGSLKTNFKFTGSKKEKGVKSKFRQST